MFHVTLNSCQQVLSSDETNDLMHWPVLRLATESFLRRVHHVFFFNKALSALLLTNDDRVFALGSNEYGSLGVDSLEPHVTEPTEVVEFRDKPVVQCASGKKFVMVLIKNGDLYGWGHNWFGQVGCGSQNPTILEPVLVLRGITMVSCGPKHTAALHRNGSILSWGDNTSHQLGFRTKSNYCPKAHVVRALKRQRVVQVECGKHITVALTDQAQLYHWGTMGDFGNLIIDSPLQVSLSTEFTPVSVSVNYKMNPTLALLTTSGNVYVAKYKYNGYMPHSYCYNCQREYEDDDDEDIDKYIFNWRKVYLSEPVQALVKGDSKLCVKLQSGQVALVTHSDHVYTSLTSMADACALYTNQQVMPGLTHLPSSLISPVMMQSIYKFHNPVNHDLKIASYDDKKVIYLDTKKTAQCSTYLAEKFQGSWRGKSFVNICNNFVYYFTFVRYVHTGTVGVIEPSWISELLTLAIDTNTVGLRDLCVHTFINHIDNGTKILLQTVSKPETVRIDSILSVANVAPLPKKFENDNLDVKIWRCLATESLFTARKLLLNLQAISGETDLSETDNLPESYLQLMIDFSDEPSLVGLLQDVELGQFFSRYLATTLTSDNCLHHFRLAVKTKDDILLQQVVRFVANLDHDHLISLLNSEGIKQFNGDQMRTLFSLVSKWRVTSQSCVSTKRNANYLTTGSSHKHHKKA